MSDLITVRASIEGVADMMMHNRQLSDPLNPWTKKLKGLTSKRKKEEADHLEMQKVEFFGGLYYAPEIGVYVPADCIQAALCEGAKQDKLGKAFLSAVFVEKDAPLIYDGPRTPEELWDTGKYHDVRSVAVQTSRVNRCRPIFRKGWSVDFEINVLTGGGVEVSEVKRALEKAGLLKGLCEYRPRYGRFAVKKFETV